LGETVKGRSIRWLTGLSFTSSRQQLR